MKGPVTQRPKNSDQGGSFYEKSNPLIFLLYKLLSETLIGLWHPDFDARVKIFDKGLFRTNMKGIGTRKSGSINFPREGSTLIYINSQDIDIHFQTCCSSKNTQKMVPAVGQQVAVSVTRLQFNEGLEIPCCITHCFKVHLMLESSLILSRMYASLTIYIATRHL